MRILFNFTKQAPKFGGQGFENYFSHFPVKLFSGEGYKKGGGRYNSLSIGGTKYLIEHLWMHKKNSKSRKRILSLFLK